MSIFGKRKGGGRRSASRTPVPLIAVVTTLAESQSAIVVDVSSTGIRLHGADLPRKGEELFVNVEGVMAFGTVAWAADQQRGIEFDSPLCSGTEQMLRHKVAQAAGLPPEIKAAYDDWTLGVAR